MNYADEMDKVTTNNSRYGMRQAGGPHGWSTASANVNKDAMWSPYTSLDQGPKPKATMPKPRTPTTSGKVNSHVTYPGASNKVSEYDVCIQCDECSQWYHASC